MARRTRMARVRHGTAALSTLCRGSASAIHGARPVTRSSRCVLSRMEAALTQTVARHRLTHDDLLAPFHEAFKPEDKWRVGAEAEKFGVLATRSSRFPTRARAACAPCSTRCGALRLAARERVRGRRRDRAASAATARSRSSPAASSSSPGAPFTSIHDTARRVQRSTSPSCASSASRSASRGSGSGFHPFARAATTAAGCPSCATAIMREYLPTRGSIGLDMMLRTCTVQANLDYSSEADAMRKLRVAARALAAHHRDVREQPVLRGQAQRASRRAARGLARHRSRSLRPPAVRLEASMSRSSDYVEWALDVPMFLVKRDGKIVHNTGQTFRAFMRRRLRGPQAPR